MQLENGKEIPDQKAQFYGAVAGVVLGSVVLLIRNGIPAHGDDVGAFGAAIIAFSFTGAVVFSLFAAFRDMRS